MDNQSYIKKSKGILDVDLIEIEFNSCKSYDELFDVLSLCEKEKYKRFKFNEHAIKYVYSRGILRMLLSEYLNINPKDIEISYGKFNKPYIKNSELKFNLSHTENKIVYAFSNKFEIGVDIEEIKNYDDLNLLISEVFGKEEIEYFNNSILAANGFLNKNKVFTQFWTCKEALMKSTGLGVYLEPKNICVDIETPCIKYINHNYLLAENFITTYINFDESNICTLCVQL